jgi:hypothetical protein
MNRPRERSLRLWDDNPTNTDLLGFDAVVSPVLDALATPDLDPLTIGVHSPWGGGKSTVLRLLDDELFDDKRYVVISVDPWTFDDHADVRGTLMAQILDELFLRFEETADVKELVDELLRRISWSRVAMALGKGAFTMNWEPDALMKAFTPEKRNSDKSMSGFRDKFKELVCKLPGVERVVVLVDDLDRCLPEAVMATMEAIKLFLSVDKMVFVLAADEDMVRDAIAASLSRTSRSEDFADFYLEKIVHLPVPLPRLAPHDAEAYIGLLLAGQHAPKDGDALDLLIDHCAARRRAGETTLLAELDGLAWQPEADLLHLAAQLAQGLSADRLSNPRKIKRFLNAFGVRQSIANARDIKIAAPVLVKMLLLETHFRASFEHLAATAGPDRQELLASWEAWGRGEADTRPHDKIEEGTRDWAASEPSLAAENLDPYLTLAATLLNVRSGGQVSDATAALVKAALTGGSAEADAAVTMLATLPPSEQADALNFMFRNARRLPDLAKMFTAASGWAASTPALAERIAEGLREFKKRVDAEAVVDMKQSGVPELLALVAEIGADPDADPMARDAAGMT